MKSPNLALSLENLESSLALLNSLDHDLLNRVRTVAPMLALSDDHLQIFCDDTLVLDDVKDLEKSLAQTFDPGVRLMLPRLSNSLHDIHPAPSACLTQALNSSDNKIIEGLKTHPPFEVKRERAPIEWARTLFILGAPVLAVIDIQSLPSTINEIVIVETNPRDIAIAFSLCNLGNLVNAAKERSVGIQIIFDSDVANLQARLREQIVGLRPMMLNGMYLCRSPIENSQLSIVDSWLRSPEGMTQSVAGGLGGDVDELNQLLQALFTAVRISSRSLLSRDSRRADLPIVLVASGPSLDKSLPWLKQHQAQLQIVSAGSSLGSLVRNGIYPDAAVFLERSSIVYENDICELLGEGFDLSHIPLMAAMTLDPRIASCFGPVAWFHRPLSCTLAFFHDEANSKLLQSGPQSANAALEAILHLGHKKIMLVGCDFGAETRSLTRASQALGSSDRELDLPVIGRSGKTIFSSSTLYDAAQYFANAVRAYGAEIYSIPQGIALDGVDLQLVDLNDTLASSFANQKPISDGWGLSDLGVLSNQEAERRLVDFSNSIHLYFSDLTKLVNGSSSWSLTLFRQLDQILKLDETGLSPAQALVKRLVHYPVFLALQPLHDSCDREWDQMKQLAVSNLRWLESVYSTYVELLIRLNKSAAKQSFDWQWIKEELLSISALHEV